jgi:hypothetical protein
VLLTGFYIPAHERGMDNYHYDENGMDEDFGGSGNSQNIDVYLILIVFLEIYNLVIHNQ